ncbi:MAG: hypothetical protein IKQ61_13795 [Spirochaetales bacterium]|nr:hypothetical protein [Spirochaetales bacterium]
MPVKFKKIKKNLEVSSIGLGAFPVIAEGGFIPSTEPQIMPIRTVSDDTMPTSRIRQSVHETVTKRAESVPKIPTSFYTGPAANDDALSRELDILDSPVKHSDSRLSGFLLNLKNSIYADRTWFASGKRGDAVYSLTSCDDDIQDAVSADNGLIAHAMSIDHLMFVKNKMYIDELVDNSIGMTSLFIVPINKPNMHGMVLAGYKSPKGELSKIVTTLNECRMTAAEYL